MWWFTVQPLASVCNSNNIKQQVKSTNSVTCALKPGRPDQGGPGMVEEQVLFRVIVVGPNLRRQRPDIRSGRPPVVAAVVPGRSDGRALHVDACARSPVNKLARTETQRKQCGEHGYVSFQWVVIAAPDCAT